MYRLSGVLAIMIALVGAACTPRVEVPGDELPEADAPNVTVPTIRVTPDHGLPGSEVRIAASGFPESDSVVVGFGPLNSEYEVLERVRTDDQGQVETSVTVPTWAERARPYVWVVASPDNEPRAVSGRFLIATAEEAAERQVRIEGTVTDEGVECPAMRDSDGALYTLAGAPDWVIPGVEIVVEGQVAEMSFCQQGTTIDVSEVTRR